MDYLSSELPEYIMPFKSKRYWLQQGVVDCIIEPNAGVHTDV